METSTHTLVAPPDPPAPVVLDPRGLANAAQASTLARHAAALAQRWSLTPAQVVVRALAIGPQDAVRAVVDAPVWRELGPVYAVTVCPRGGVLRAS